MHHDVRLTQHLQQRRTPFGGFEIKRNAAFVPVHRHPLSGHTRRARDAEAPVIVAFRRFDLDHIGPEIAQELGGVGGEENMAQFHNAHPVEHLKHDSLPAVLSSVPATRRGKRL